MNLKALVGITPVAIILTLLLATGCGESTATATPIVPPEFSPTAEQPTVIPTQAPTEAQTKAPTPRPTRTPVPPKPTPTPTYGEQTVSRFSWYANEETNFAAKSQLIGLLLRISEEYPLLFDALIQQAWINPPDVPETLEPVVDVVDAIAFVTRTADDETAAVKVVHMPFLDVIDGEEVDLLEELANLARGGAGGFNTFLDHVIANGGLTGSERRVDVLYAYMEAQDPAGMERLFEGRLPEPSDIHMFEDLVQLYWDYPILYSAVSVHSAKNFQYHGLARHASRLAAIDEELAHRLAQMPFNGIRGGISGNAWTLTRRAAEENLEAASRILETYETGGGMEHTDLATYAMDITSVFSPDTVETVRSFEWVADGLDAPDFREDDRGRRALPSDEEETVLTILMAAWRGEIWLETLLEKEWIRDDLTSDEDVAVNRVTQFEDAVTQALLGMQFLDEVDREDRMLLVPIGNFLLEEGEASQESRLSDLLSDSRIDGEITDANRHLVESVIDDLSEDL